MSGSLTEAATFVGAAPDCLGVCMQCTRFYRVAKVTSHDTLLCVGQGKHAGLDV